MFDVLDFHTKEIYAHDLSFGELCQFLIDVFSEENQSMSDIEEFVKYVYSDKFLDYLVVDKEAIQKVNSYTFIVRRIEE